MAIDSLCVVPHNSHVRRQYVLIPGLVGDQVCGALGITARFDRCPIYLPNIDNESYVMIMSFVYLCTWSDMQTPTRDNLYLHCERELPHMNIYVT